MLFWTAFFLVSVSDAAECEATSALLECSVLLLESSAATDSCCQGNGGARGADTTGGYVPPRDARTPAFSQRDQDLRAGLAAAAYVPPTAASSSPRDGATPFVAPSDPFASHSASDPSTWDCHNCRNTMQSGRDTCKICGWTRNGVQPQAQQAFSGASSSTYNPSVTPSAPALSSLSQAVSQDEMAMAELRETRGESSFEASEQGPPVVQDCSICLGPKQRITLALPCCHTFCRRCIENHLRTNTERLCPMCNIRVVNTRPLYL